MQVKIQALILTKQHTFVTNKSFKTLKRDVTAQKVYFFIIKNLLGGEIHQNRWLPRDHSEQPSGILIMKSY